MPDQDPARDLLSQATRAYLGGNSDEGLRLLDEALATASGDDTMLRSFLLVQKAGWLRESGRPADAADTLAQAERELGKLPQAGHETEWGGLRMEQALAAKRRGEFDAAEAFLAEAESLARLSPARDLLLTDVFANQASLFMERGKLSEAQRALLDALEIDQRVGNLRSESNDLNMLGLVSGQLGDPDTARAYLTRAMDVAQQAGLVREAMDAATNLAALLDNAGDHERAAEIFRQVGQAQAEGGDDSGVACSVANQGVAAALAGRPAEAAELLHRSHELHLAVGNTLHAVQDQLNLTGVEQQQGNLQAALALGEQALAEARRYGLVELLWQAEFAVASLRADLAPQLATEDEPIRPFEDALAGYGRAADLVELLRSGVDSPDARGSLLAGKEMIYDQAITLALAMGRTPQAFQFSERARMRSFLEGLGSARLEQLAGHGPASQRRAELAGRLLSPDTPAADKPGLLDELRTVRAEIIARQPVVAAITEAELPSEQDIRAAIPGGTAVLEYFQLTNSVVMFLLTGDGLADCAVTTLREPVEEVVRRFRDEIAGVDAGLNAGHQLFRALLGPVMRSLGSTENLIVVPHRSLHYVPFSALWYEPEGADAPPRQYLKNRFYLSVVPSASYLPYLARATASAPQPGAPVVLGNPTGDLAGADDEARAVAARLGVAPLLRGQATRAALFGAQAPLVLHVAAHGDYNGADALLSGVHLADGVVTVEDLLSTGPAPRLLVLSGCVTGIAGRRPGDELTGLAQAALRGGTRSVVATLWETFDDSSAAFFGNFYEALVQGYRVSEALAWARETLATGPDGYDQPADWAPFLLIGDPEQRLVEPEHSPMAVFDRGVDLMQEGDRAGAKAAFQSVLGGPSAEASGRAGYALGILLRDEGDMPGALAAWRRAADSGDASAAPLAMYALGDLLETQGDPDGALAVYQRAMAGNHPKAAPLSALNLGALLAGRGDIDGACVAFRQAAASGHPEAGPKAAYNLGVLLAQRGDISAARAALQQAIDSGDAQLAPAAARTLAELPGG